jgi:hypothetical protein
MCVLIQLCMCPHTTICFRIPLYVSSYYYYVSSILLYMCLHTTIYMSSCYYMCPHTTICVLMLLYICPHTSIHVCSRVFLEVRAGRMAVDEAATDCNRLQQICNRAATEPQQSRNRSATELCGAEAVDEAVSATQRRCSSVAAHSALAALLQLLLLDPHARCGAAVSLY